MVTTIQKRDGRLVPFDIEKITAAIEKAQKAIERNHPHPYIKAISRSVVMDLEKIYDESNPPTVEQVQDIVEKTLMDCGLSDIAKEYIIYRAERTRVREMNSKLMMTYNDLTFKAAKDSDIKRENANINADTAMGTMLKYGSEGAKKFNELYVLKPAHSRAHANGDIHIHDLDYLTLTETCCQIDLLKLFHGGFSTGHGHLREPNSIVVYSALACIAIQSDQNDQHGGQSVPNFDYAMAEGVKKTFKHKFFQNLQKCLDMKYNINELLGDTSFNEKMTDLKKALDTKGIIPCLNMSDFDVDVMTTIIGNQLIAPMSSILPIITISEIKTIVTRALKYAEKETDRETYQAMEALIHNLNTMNSRAGAQVPFSSINYGMDTTPEGRMVIKNVLLAEEAGLGMGETPIFPIHIFKVKEGINYNKEDPNYDLFKLACRVSAKRLFPNFSFIDAPFNLQYYKPGDYNTEVAYMGCVEGSEIVTYTLDSVLYVEGIARAWDRIANTGASIYYNGMSTYIDLTGNNTPDVQIYDTHTGGFVKVKAWIKNPNRDNWLRIRLSNGRSLIATDDHPLPVKDKGRTYARDLSVYDEIPVTYSQYSPETKITPNFSTKFAWLLGVLICDGSYANNITISLGEDERDIAAFIDEVITNENISEIIGSSNKSEYKGNYIDIIGSRNKSEYSTHIIHQSRGVKGNYIDINIKCGQNLRPFREWLADIFDGVKKIDRHIPTEVFSWPDEYKAAFIAGMMDADGYIHPRTGYGMLGSTNKEFALQQMALLQSIGIPAKYYPNKYKLESDALRTRVEFRISPVIVSEMQCLKKTHIYENTEAFNMETPEYATVISIEMIDLDDLSYDVTTESDRFDVSGILSHNCRTRVIGNVYDTEREIVTGRGNLSFTSINLPRLALKADGDIDKFFDSLDEMLDLVVDQLLERYKIQASKTVRNYPFLMGQGVWIDSEKLGPDDTIGEILKHGSLSVGFIGLAECLKALVGKHHGEDESARKLGYKIIQFMRDRMDEESEKHQLNFTLLATPAEGLSGRFVRMDKKIYGEIEGITDKEYYTNSFHVPVYYHINAFDKIKIESPFHAMTNAGHISYIELDGDPCNNLDAFEKIVRCMKESGIGYGSINHPVDRDPVCGYTGIIGDECPQCHRHDHDDGIKFERIRRITGYLVGTLDRFNDAKLAEVRDRVKHNANQ